VAAQYSGAKAGLRPVYDALEKKIRAFGQDVELAPKKAYVSLRRSKQFGLLQPSTATRLDVGLNLKNAPAKGRLEASGSFNSMCTHRVRVETVKDVDAELVSWLKEAYDRA
jgi:predicted transport protein